jgi:hypothetical protein
MRKTAYNTGFASGGVTCKLGALCFVSSSVLADSLELRKRELLVAANRYLPFLGDSVNTNRPTKNIQL